VSESEIFYVFPGFECALFLLGKTSLVLSKANPNTLTKIPFFQRGQSHFQISYAQKVHSISFAYTHIIS